MKKTKNSKILRLISAYLPPVLWAGLIFILSAQSTLPSLSASPFDFIFKKSAHMFVYAVLFLLMHRAILKTSHQPNVQIAPIWPWALLICLVYATADELHQGLVPGRFATLRDVGYDMLGAGISLLYKYRYI